MTAARLAPCLVAYLSASLLAACADASDGPHCPPLEELETEWAVSWHDFERLADEPPPPMRFVATGEHRTGASRCDDCVVLEGRATAEQDGVRWDYAIEVAIPPDAAPGDTIAVGGAARASGGLTIGNGGSGAIVFVGDATGEITIESVEDGYQARFDLVFRGLPYGFDATRRLTGSVGDAWVDALCT